MAGVDKAGKPRLEAVDQPARGGSIALVALVALTLVASAVGLWWLGRPHAEPYVVGLLAVLAVVGIFSLFAGAAGLLQFAGGGEQRHLTRDVVDGSSDAVVVTDPTGRPVYGNRAYLAFAGAESIDAARPVERVLPSHPDVAEPVYRLVQAAREGKRHTEEMRAPGAREGEPARWLRVRVAPLEGEADRPRGATWTVADVTRERERQENIFQELQHAIDFLDHAPAGFFSAEPDTRLSYVNATLAQWLDYDLAEVGSGGLKLGDILPGDGAALITTLTGAPGEVRTTVLDVDLATRGGTRLPARLMHKTTFGPEGKPGASRTLVINRQRRTGDEADPARAAEVRFARFFNTTPIGIATVDVAGRIGRSNASFATLIGKGAEAPGAVPGEARSVLALVAERDRPAVAQRIAAASRGEAPAADAAPHVDVALSGTGSRAARIYVTPVEDADASAGEAAIVYLVETTEQRALEAQFAQSMKMQAVGQLAGGIAHDFNNVLSAIILATDFLLQSHKPTDPSFQDIIQIKQNANRAASLVRQLLAFSRRQTLRPQVLDLGEVLSDLTILLRRLIGEKVTLDMVHGRDLWPVKADLSQFEQVVVNLAVNARDAMPDGGRLVVRTANVSAAEAARYGEPTLPAADYVLVEVTDTGTGIPPAVMEKIFEPFFTTKEVGKGTGLGLSTVYGIVKQTGGFIYPASEVGKGTTFRIFLPRHQGEPEVVAPPAALSAAAPVPAPTGKAAALPGAPAAPAADLTGQGTILLVEDEESLRGLNGRGLTSRGYTVLEAANGVEALRIFEERGGAVDIVVSDVVMPEMDGPSLLVALRARAPEVKFIFVSGYAEDAFEKNLPKDQQFAFLPKPFTLKQLVAAVKQTMAGNPPAA